MLEELGLPYEAIPVDTRRGDQHKPEYLAINPNAKAPSIVDDGVPVFDSNAILLYLAEKHQRFLPDEKLESRAQLLSWLMFVASGVGPFSGQSIHFGHSAPEKIPYAMNRYQFEAKRHYGILNAQLAKGTYMLGDTYTIVDMAVWGWARMMPRAVGEENVSQFSNVTRLVNEISARPAAERANAIKDRHTFKTEMDDEAKRAMFPSNYASIG